ncbi:UNVERIFIED_CONTAM: hypothetical protein HHA_313360 [Hammondia hammondi]|eukprot:XP_008883583.1 hypothetical protein HHA_313360 [Hammondia hammondi]
MSLRGPEKREQRRRGVSAYAGVFGAYSASRAERRETGRDHTRRKGLSLHRDRSPSSPLPPPCFASVATRVALEAAANSDAKFRASRVGEQNRGTKERGRRKQPHSTDQGMTEVALPRFGSTSDSSFPLSQSAFVEPKCHEERLVAEVASSSKESSIGASLRSPASGVHTPVSKSPPCFAVEKMAYSERGFRACISAGGSCSRSVESRVVAAYVSSESAACEDQCRFDADPTASVSSVSLPTVSVRECLPSCASPRSAPSLRCGECSREAEGASGESPQEETADEFHAPKRGAVCNLSSSWAGPSHRRQSTEAGSTGDTRKECMRRSVSATSRRRTTSGGVEASPPLSEVTASRVGERDIREDACSPSRGCPTSSSIEPISGVSPSHASVNCSSLACPSASPSPLSGCPPALLCEATSAEETQHGVPAFLSSSLPVSSSVSSTSRLPSSLPSSSPRAQVGDACSSASASPSSSVSPSVYPHSPLSRSPAQPQGCSPGLAESVSSVGEVNSSSPRTKLSTGPRSAHLFREERAALSATGALMKEELRRLLSAASQEARTECELLQEKLKQIEAENARREAAMRQQEAESQSVCVISGHSASGASWRSSSGSYGLAHWRQRGSSRGGVSPLSSSASLSPGAAEAAPENADRSAASIPTLESLAGHELQVASLSSLRDCRISCCVSRESRPTTPPALDQRGVHTPGFASRVQELSAARLRPEESESVGGADPQDFAFFGSQHAAPLSVALGRDGRSPSDVTPQLQPHGHCTSSPVSSRDAEPGNAGCLLLSLGSAGWSSGSPPEFLLASSRTLSSRFQVLSAKPLPQTCEGTRCLTAFSPLHSSVSPREDVSNGYLGQQAADTAVSSDPLSLPHVSEEAEKSREFLFQRFLPFFSRKSVDCGWKNPLRPPQRAEGSPHAFATDSGDAELLCRRRWRQRQTSPAGQLLSAVRAEGGEWGSGRGQETCAAEKGVGTSGAKQDSQAVLRQAGFCSGDRQPSEQDGGDAAEERNSAGARSAGWLRLSLFSRESRPGLLGTLFSLFSKEETKRQGDSIAGAAPDNDKRAQGSEAVVFASVGTRGKAREANEEEKARSESTFPVTVASRDFASRVSTGDTSGANGGDTKRDPRSSARADAKPLASSCDASALDVRDRRSEEDCQRQQRPRVLEGARIPVFHTKADWLAGLSWQQDVRRGTGDSTSTRTSSQTRVGGSRGAEQGSSPGSRSHLSCPTPLAYSVEASSPSERLRVHRHPGCFEGSEVGETSHRETDSSEQRSGATRTSNGGSVCGDNASRTGFMTSDEAGRERTRVQFPVVSIVKNIAKDCPRCKRQVLLEVLRLNSQTSPSESQTQKKRLVRAAPIQPVGFCVCWVLKNSRGGETRNEARSRESKRISKRKGSAHAETERETSPCLAQPSASVGSNSRSASEEALVSGKEASRGGACVPGGRSEGAEDPGIDRERENKSGAGADRRGTGDQEGNATDASLWVQAMMLMDM